MASAQRAFTQSEGGAIPAATWERAHAVWAELGAFEWVALAYLALSGVLMIGFRFRLPNAAMHLAIHAAAAILIVFLSSSASFARSARAQPRIATGAKWVRDWYPQAVFLFCFEELHILVHLVQPAWQDPLLIRFDLWLTGTNPAVWFSGIATPALNELMQAAYLSYFFFLTVLGASLYRKARTNSSTGQFDAARTEARAYWAVMTSSIVAYALGYVVSILFPIEAPYYSLAALHLPELRGGAATALINLIEHFGRVHGGAFPSAHVSGSFVALLGAWKYRRRMFCIFLPLFLAMCTATVYGRYHYVADVLAGIVVGAIGFWAGHKLMALPGAAPRHRCSDDR